jgi:type IV pilus assembly protein PilA
MRLRSPQIKTPTDIPKPTSPTTDIASTEVEPAIAPATLSPQPSNPSQERRWRGRLLILSLTGGILGGLALFSLPLVMCGGSRARTAEARAYVGSMNRAQQAVYLETGAFARTIDDLGMGIPSRTRYYHYEIHRQSVVVNDKQPPETWVIQSATVQPTSDQTWSLFNLDPVKVRAIAGAVAPNLAAGADKDSTITILCQAIEPGPRAIGSAKLQGIASPTYHNGQLRCGPGSNPL